jgi:hypothetical protein
MREFDPFPVRQRLGGATVLSSGHMLLPCHLLPENGKSQEKIRSRHEHKLHTMVLVHSMGDMKHVHSLGVLIPGLGN